PIAIALVQTLAKKLLSQYWDQYTTLGDTFLENLQGLVTLKLYSADEYRNKVMNKESEKFRRITMKVLTMQLNSITIMDLVAYGGAALGMAMAVIEASKGRIDIGTCIFIILISADFFIPMRKLGSFFHVAMNGMAASDRIFKLLDMEERKDGTEHFPKEGGIEIKNLDYSYTKERKILSDISLSIEDGAFVGIVGESGCGKSTLAGVITGKNRNYTGTLEFNGVKASDIKEEEILKNITYIGHHSTCFKGTLRENLALGNPEAGEKEMWEALKKVKIDGFVSASGGLEMKIDERGANLSGGQCQRIALARALLHDSRIYILDEATSNIDVESENDIMEAVREMTGKKTIILISHRLMNTMNADRIYVLDKGQIIEKGSHEELLRDKGVYEKLWNSQKRLEEFSGKEAI
ncbi:MAG: ABC transporter ATP-binding protein/permease, partial [Candidatus Ornithospirochaeta sp.]